MCLTNSTACLDECIAANPNGQTKFEALFTCADVACPASCAYGGFQPATCPAGMACVRIADMIPDALAYDVCLKKGPLPPFGPLFAGASTSGGAIAYLEVSKLIAVAPDAYAIFVVKQGTSCASTIATTTATLAAGETWEIVTYGLSAAPKIAAFRNDVQATGKNITLRELSFVNTLPAPGTLDTGLWGGASLSLVFHAGLAVATAATAGVNLDANGYNTVSLADLGVSGPKAQASWGALVHGTSTQVHVGFVDLDESTTGTLFHAGIFGSTAHPPLFLQCNDWLDAGDYNFCFGH